MTTALVLGGGHSLYDDLRKVREAGLQFDGVVACNDAGMEWPHSLDAWVSLHCWYFVDKKWRQTRRERGFPEAKRHYGHPEAFTGSLAKQQSLTGDLLRTPYSFAGEKSGSSGLFAAKVALVDLSFDTVILCGVPMTKTPHYWDATETNWDSAEGFRKSWLNVPKDYRDRMRSLSGWTRVLLGAPGYQ